jgi:hypothetical protein
MRILIILAILALPIVGSSQKAAPPKKPYETDKYTTKPNVIDRCVMTQLKIKGIMPSRPCSNDVFLRRIYLDLIGTLPTPNEQMLFALDKPEGKRARWIEMLLNREEFVDYWTMKWCDLLRVKAEFPINLWPNGVQAYHRWIRDAVETNLSYDRFAHQLLTSSGSNFRVAPVNFYRAVQGRTPEGLADAVALTFMGVRLDKLPNRTQANMAKFFSRVAYKKTSEWKEEIVYLDPKPVDVFTTKFPNGTSVTIEPTQDPRKVFANWLVTPKNKWFARNAVNRMWYWFMGRGIVHQPDDIRPDNPPSNVKLLATLEREFVKRKFNMKDMFRLICNSQTYQRSAIPASKHPKAGELFAYYHVRPLQAEVLSDALTWILGQKERFSSQIPEPYTFIPDNQRTILLSDGSITSQFLEMFGRPSRDTGLESERSRHSSAAQRLFMLNSTQIQAGVAKSPRLRQLIRRFGKKQPDMIKVVYRTILSRGPTQKELTTVLNYVKSYKDKRKQRGALADLTWALLNSKEFLYKH